MRKKECWCEQDLDGATLYCAKPESGNLAVAIAVAAGQGIMVDGVWLSTGVWLDISRPRRRADGEKQ